MKPKNILHPRLYLNIVKKNSKHITIEYKDNEFLDNGQRIIKTCRLDFKEKYKNYSKLSEIVGILNSLELNKIKKYIKIQNKVLEYHKKNNNFDAVDTVECSIEIMNNFKKEFLAYEF